MKLVAFLNHGTPEPGILQDGFVIGLKAAGFTSLLALIEEGSPAVKRAAQWASRAPADQKFALSAVQLLTPVPNPPKLIFIGLNYRDHAIECGAALPKVPAVFSKYNTAIVGPGDAIVLPAMSAQPDYEAELGVVIGKRGRRIPIDKWQDYVFGYTNVHDVSARDVQMATSQWLMGKTFDTFAPIGPAIVTADEIPDPNALKIELLIDGEALQSSNTSEMVFQVPYLIEHLSRVMTLEPGDIISTGTPAGVGMAKTPQRWLRPGDNPVVRIEGIPELHNTVRAE